MHSEQDLRRELGRIDGRGYKAYKDIRDRYDLGSFRLSIDYVQGDPFAAPSRLRAEIPFAGTGLPERARTHPVRRAATADWLVRRFVRAARHARGRRGSGKSGLVAIDEPGQEVLPRTAALVAEDRVELRFVTGLPAKGRRILGDEAVELLCHDVPEAVARAALELNAGETTDLDRHLDAVEDQVHLREALRDRGLVAFLADGSILPRESGVSDRPLTGARVVPFQSPPPLAVEIGTPHSGTVLGMGIPQGITLVVGGGYHGKSTLLEALARGIYDHIPGDGREGVVTDPTAMKIRAEDGRRVERVDISPFIGELPTGDDTRSLRTENASGSTSQAANIVEALELGARALLIDEDTSATNFMIRDRRMQLLVAKEEEPITPFIDLVRSLFEELGVSTVLVMGGSGDYLEVADTVIQMEAFRPRDVTDRAREVARQIPTGRVAEVSGPASPPAGRVPDPSSIDPRRGRKVRIRDQGVEGITFGREEIDLRAVEQLVSPSQTRTIGLLIDRLRRHHLDGDRTLRQALERAYTELDQQGLDSLSPFSTPVGDLALPRALEVGAALNRLRSLKVLG